MAERVGLWKDGWRLGDSKLELSASQFHANKLNTGDLGKKEVGRNKQAYEYSSLMNEQI